MPGTFFFYRFFVFFLLVAFGVFRGGGVSFGGLGFFGFCLESRGSQGSPCPWPNYPIVNVYGSHVYHMANKILFNITVLNVFMEIRCIFVQ